MFKHYFITAWRNLWKNKVLSAINIIGLAVGTCCVILAILYWQDERSYDQFHKNNPNLYRITTSLIENKADKPVLTGATGQVQGPAFKAQIPEVVKYTRVLGGGITSDYNAGEKVLKLKTLFADDTFFDVFTFKFIHGNPATALNELSAAVITEETALKLFNKTDVIGRQLHMESDPSAKRLGKPLVIAGVVENPPKHSTIRFEILHPFQFLQLSFNDENWLNAYLGTFIVLHPSANKEKVIQKFNQIYLQNAKAQIQQNGHDPKVSYGLQPITDIHLNSYTSNGNSMEAGVLNGSKPIFSYLFLGISAFILLMACINFINLHIAGSLKRTKEVVIRKINGSSRLHIILQFLGESAILCILAFITAILLTYSVLPFFNDLAGKEIELKDFGASLFVGVILLLVLNILLTGFYPAYLLSRFKAVETLNNKQTFSKKNYFGQTLIVIQFVIAIALALGSAVSYKQMTFIKTKNLGYNPYQVVITNISGNRDYKPIRELLKNEIAKEPSIEQISFGGESGESNTLIGELTLKSAYRRVDQNHLSTLGIGLKAGTNFTHEDSNEALVNESFVRLAGLKNPIGTTFRQDNGGPVLTISGIVKDFHFSSLKEKIQPMVMYQELENSGSIWLKIDHSQQKEALAAFERIYKKAIPGAIYEYDFMDDLNAREYKQEQRWEKIISIATIVSLLICCLGLFGLTQLAAQQKTKEIGIRKVIGASVQQIVMLLSADFLKLIAISFLVAFPISWYAAHKWLENFTYRINIPIEVFILTGILAMLLALITISFHALKAARANPIKSLRTE
jgi:putative ABC transport system permease protein